jgi:hypothetical protein
VIGASRQDCHLVAVADRQALHLLLERFGQPCLSAAAALRFQLVVRSALGGSGRATVRGASGFESSLRSSGLDPLLGVSRWARNADAQPNVPTELFE